MECKKTKISPIKREEAKVWVFEQFFPIIMVNMVSIVYIYKLLLSRSRYLDRGIVGISIDSSKWEADRHSLLIFLNVCPSH